MTWLCFPPGSLRFEFDEERDVQVESDFFRVTYRFTFTP